MLRWNAVLQNIREQVTAPLIRSAHPCLPFGKNTGIIFAGLCQPSFFSGLLSCSLSRTQTQDLVSGFAERKLKASRRARQEAETEDAG